MYLGIDVGTSSLKAVLANDNGLIIASESISYNLSLPKENWSEQNPNDWYLAEIKAIMELGKKYDLKKIKAVSFCGQMHGLVLLDKNDKIIRPAILWNDNRTIKECEYLNNTIGKKKLIDLTGNIAITGFTGPKILWVRKNEPANFKKIEKIMLPKDYAAYKMSGIFATDVSDASGTLYFDVSNKKWSQEMLKILGICEKQLPKIYESYQVIGNVSSDFAKITGMSTTTKVVIGGGDQAVGAIGTGTVNNDMLSISLGTSGVLFLSSDKFKKINSGIMHSFAHANGKYHIMGVMLSAAGSFDWWANTIIKTRHYNELMDGVKKTIDSNLIFLPYLTGERSPINDPLAKGSLLGLTLAHTRDDISRAVINGINFGLLDNLLAIKALGFNPLSARVVGGGAKSKIWLQMLADTLGIKLHTINTSEGGALGAIILAMVGDKKYKTVEIACNKIIKITNTYIPSNNLHKKYLLHYKKFKNYYNAIKNI